ncbi:hypothetical protein AAF712_010618 [Marasmius tenuissimus]|uniref:RING-type domain-containing protein n=1 Tax=Marasmius tenuissimus TaxID=585030 RepID=A0ABR2ZME5_9AGAR
MILFICDICQDDKSLDDFTFEAACGHGFCKNCSEETKSRENCSLCRKPKLKNVPPHRVYLTPSTSAIEDQATSLTNSLSALDSNSTPRRFQNVATKTRVISARLDSEGDTASKLLDAAKGMEERLQYFAQQLQLERDEKKALQEKVDLWHSRIIQAGAQERENTCLKASIRESKQDIAHLQTENNNLARHIDAMRKEQEKLQGTNSRHGKAAVEKDELIEELTHAKEEAEKKVQRIYLLCHPPAHKDHQNRLFKQKLKALTSSKSSRTPTDHANDSLLVDYSDTVRQPSLRPTLQH